MKGRRRPDAYSRFFLILSLPERLRIFLALAGGSKTVTQLVEELGIRQPDVSHHLAKMRQARVVKYDPEWKLHHYKIDADHLVRLFGYNFVFCGFSLTGRRTHD